jgi:hypothetical protein
VSVCRNPRGQAYHCIFFVVVWTEPRVNVPFRETRVPNFVGQLSRQAANHVPDAKHQKQQKREQRGIERNEGFSVHGCKSYQFVASTASRFVNSLPDGAFFKDGTMAITLGRTLEPLTHIGHVDKTLLDERVRLD